MEEVRKPINSVQKYFCFFLCVFYMHIHTNAPISTKFVTIVKALPAKVIDTKGKGKAIPITDRGGS
jgi:hypothetical protein